MAWLRFADDNATVSRKTYPADSLRRASAFYSDPASVEAVLALRSEGWQVHRKLERLSICPSLRKHSPRPVLAQHAAVLAVTQVGSTASYSASASLRLGSISGSSRIMRVG